MIDFIAAAVSWLLMAAIIAAILRIVAGQWIQRRLGKWRFPLLLLIAALPTFHIALKFSNARTIQAFGEPMTRVLRDDRVVALTFDDGPLPAATPKILAMLAEADVPATFFVNGKDLARFPTLGPMLVAAGHELGNHGDTHSMLIGKSLDTLRGELDRTDAQIRRAGYTGPIHFRPPYGKKFVALPWLLKRTGRTTILWDIEPDSKRAMADDSAGMVSYVSERVQPGSIIIMHVMTSTRQPSLDAVPGIITELKGKGYRFVTVSELIATRG